MRRLLVKYSKEGDASFLSHREVMRALERALRRCELPLVFTEGYSPRPRMSFSPALPLGVAAEAEYIEVGVDGEVDEEDARERLNRALPEGLRIREIDSLAPTMPKLSRWTHYGLFRVEDEEGASYLLLVLSGEGQGRLKDAMEVFTALRGTPSGHSMVTRVGLYASPDEVFEDAPGTVLFYDGAKGEMEEMTVETEQGKR
jgi:radical SAM-linked protein